MKIVYYDSYPPRSWLENGAMKGLLVDIIDEAIAKRLGVPLVHEGYPWARAQAMVETGQADAFITVPTENRRAYTVVGKEPIIEFKLYIATYRDNPKLAELKTITAIDDLKPFQLVDYHGNGFAQKRLRNHRVEWLPSIASIYPFLAAQKADVLLVSDHSIYTLEQSPVKEQIVVLPQPVYSLAFHLCVGKESPHKELLPAVDRAIQQMREEGLIEKLHRQYYQ
jgi:polar amino acid transport system substrate-binding protein